MDLFYLSEIIKFPLMASKVIVLTGQLCTVLVLSISFICPVLATFYAIYIYIYIYIVWKYQTIGISPFI
jgi:hypothetical protein